MKKKTYFGRFFVRTLACVLALMLCGMLLAACSSGGETLMKLGSHKLSVNVYELLLSRMKGTLARTFGTDVLKDSFWNTTISTDGTTYNDYFTASVLDNAKTYLVALYLFDYYGLELPDSTIEAIDEEMEGLVIGDGNGSKSQLNQVLSAYGVNYDILREFYITEAKAEYLQAYLYGSNGSLIASNVKEEFMRENYVCFRQIFLASYYYVLETDAYGVTVYYTKNGDAFVYDKQNGTTMEDANGNLIVDKFGDPIYFDENGYPLYDAKNGFSVYVTDEDGEYVTGDYSEEELKKIASNIELLASMIDEGDFEDFEDMMEEYSEDEEGMDTYTNGYFLEKNTTYSYTYLNEICTALVDMNVGETRVIESSYGYHLIMKYECPEGAYAEEDNSIWFTDFTSALIEMLFLQEAEKHKADIVVDKDLLATVDMKSVSQNYYY